MTAGFFVGSGSIALKLKISVFLIAVSFAGSAWAMDAQTFYAKALALNKMGAAAVATSDFRLLTAEIKSADAALEQDNKRAKSQGKAIYCPPAKAGIGANELIAEFGKIPKNRRSKITVRQAWREIAVRKFPC